MKKSGRIICLVLALFMCVFFSSCKVKYDNLKMSFYSATGKAIDSVRLLIDENNTDNNLNQTRIAVQFDGIKAKYIGDVLLYSLPSDLINISNCNLEDNKYFATISTNGESGSGKIYAKHLTTGKTKTLNLLVDKKTNQLTNLIDEYVVSIPDSEQDFYFDPTVLISQNGTDKVAFKIATGSSLPTGATALTTDLNETPVVNGLHLTSSVAHGTSVYVYPVSYMDGYDEIDEYADARIKISFAKALNNNTFVLDTDDLHKQDGVLNLNQPFHLIAKDTNQATGGNYQFNNINFDLMYVDGANQAQNLMGETTFAYLQKYYNVNWAIPEEFKNLIEVFYNEHGQIVIEAKDYSNSIANIQISLEPKVCGNLTSVSKTVQIKCDIKPTEYEIYVQGNLQQNTGTKNNYNIDLYDYYRATDSVYGANFTFKPVLEYSYSDLKNIKIKLNPAVLDVKTDAEGLNPTGVNILHGYETLTSFANNKYLLQFYLDGKPIEFELDDDGFAVSAGIIYQDNLKRVQIKYTEISNNDDSEPLSCIITNYYSGEFEYLKSITPTQANIQFNHKEGIKELTVYAGTLTKGEGATEDSVATIIDAAERNVQVENVYLNRIDAKNNVIYATNIRGDKNKLISKANIVVKVTGGQDNPVKLLQNKANDDGTQASTEINYDYSDSVGVPFNSIILKTDANTDVGYYQIDFIYADEVIYSISCLVYERLETGDIGISVEGDNELISNKKDGDYIYSTYKAEYIVKANKNNSVTVKINLPKQFTSDYIAGYNFELNVVDETNQNVAQATEYTAQVLANNTAEITFLTGSIVSNKIAYIQVKMTVQMQEFINILTKGDVAISEAKYVNFFVFEEITKKDVKLNKTNINGYWDSLLSPYYKQDNDDKSKANLQVELSNSYLWNYVQPQIQDVDSTKIGSNLVQLSADAMYNENQTYYLADGTEIAPATENHNPTYFEENKTKLHILSSNVLWYTDVDYILSTEQQSQNGIVLKFEGVTGSASVDVYAQIKQFNLPEITLKCHIEISSPIITDKLYVTSETKQITGLNGKRVVSLKAGQEYEMTVDYYSNEFETLPSHERVITNPGFVMLVVDKAGNIHDSVVSVDGNKLRVKDDFTLTTDLHIILFARDALKVKLQDISGYTDENLSSYLMDDHSTAYTTIDLIVSNGSRQNPYSIFDEQDFTQIYQDGLAKTKYYRLMNNIYLSAVEPIDNFSGGIDTYNNSTFYTIYGVKLNNNLPNLFTNFSGTMQNINFDVKYGYKDPTATNLGVFGVVQDEATLTNVTANAYGTNITLTGRESAYINFGGLVGLNKGKIEYTSQSRIGATSDVDMVANYAYFGGLVGSNQGLIKGVTNSSTGTGEIIFSSYIENQGAVANVNISALGFEYGAVGGLVGLNQGNVKNAYVSGKILQKQSNEQNLNNVGGLVGKNLFVANNVEVSLDGTNVVALNFANELNVDTAVISNVKSSVQIDANNNIGGITAVDENGIYTNCKYQILAGSSFGLTGHDNVGGIIGNAKDSMLANCSVYSYRWDYSNINSMILTGTEKADITANNSVGGLIGFADSSASSVEQGNHNIVAIKNSSVNGYLVGTQANAIIGSNNNISTILDSYYLGNISSTNQAVNYAQNANTNFVFIFSTNVKNYFAEISTGSATINEVKDEVDLSKTVGYKVENREGWNFNKTINGSSSYIEFESKPIFDVAPTSIDLELKAESQAIYGVKNSAGDYVKGLIHLELFDYNLDSNSEDYNKNYQLQTERNTYSILDIFNIIAEPKNLLSEVRLTAKSSNSSIVLISNGYLIVREAGQATVTFSSVLNSAVRTSVIINVGKPIGDSISLYLSRDNLTINGASTEPATLKTVALTKEEALLFNFLSSGVDTNNGFNYVTNEQTYLLVNVEVVSGTLPSGKTINDYFKISGKALTLDQLDGEDNPIKGQTTISYSTPFSIKAIDKIEDVLFKFTITPYIDISGYQKFSNKFITFNVQTTSGVTGISLSSESLILYPNDTTQITAYLLTDRKIGINEAINLIDYIQLNSTTITSSSTGVFGKISDYITVLSCADLVGNRQIVKFNLTIPADIKNQLLNNVSNTMIVNFKAGAGLGNGAQDSLQLTLLKQRIDELVVRNYVYERNQDGTFNYNVYSLNNTLRPVGEGLITIDIAPINGNYDYLEISDLTGSEEIVFIQTRGIHGTRILDNVVASADGKGIRLKSSAGEGRVYVATMIDTKYTNRKHNVQVRAYVDGTIIKSTDLEIDVKMLPEVNIYLVKNDGSVDRNMVGTQYLAQGTTVKFKVETRNSDDVEPTLEITGATYTDFTSLGGGYYSLLLAENCAGNKLKISATTQLTLNNGDIEKSTESRTFDIENFVINNVSVSHSTTNNVNGEYITKIYGNLRSNVQLEFYFKNNDLTFVANDYEYSLDNYAGYATEQKPADNTESDSIYNTKHAIYNLLAGINNTNAFEKLSFDISNITEDHDCYSIVKTANTQKVVFTKNGSSTDVAILSCENDNLKIKLNQRQDIQLVLTMPVKVENHNFVLTTQEEATKTFKFNYQLDFIEESSFLEPVAVRSAEDFVNMTSGGDYILAKDLVLDAYSPIDVNLKTFDGNGHKIIINSFDLFNETTINAGLFKQIYENMVVTNLIVEYNLGRENTGYHYDLCNDSANVDYTQAVFGGITATNNGIISNCKVKGQATLSASSVERAISDDSIAFNMAGLVGTNATTGRITNSASELKMTAKANIAGVVCTNQGKIASTYFDANKDKGKIYAYNNNITVPYSIQVAGFALTNEANAEISMCYVEAETHEKSGNTIGNISAKDYSSGFVFANAGSVYDCYADIELIGESSHNHIAGFVYENTGSVKNSYSYINKGRKTNLISMFTLENTLGITDCYEIKQDVAGYKNNVEGLTTISVLNRLEKDSYPTLMFGDNSSAVWTKTSSSMPKLVATKEVVEFTGNALPDADKNTEYPAYYYGLKDLQLVKTEIKNENGVVVNVEYKYKILANNYGDIQNPILIYDLATWNYYLGQTDETNSYYNNTKYYFRVINDIDFSSVYNNPTTSTVEFNGNLQGNNMDIVGFRIYSSQNLDSIGLFASFKSLNNKSMLSAVRNLDLAPISVSATRTRAVGVLAGISENYNLYNLDIEASGVTVVGGNAVGGVAGFVRGKFDIDGATSNVGVYSSRSQQENKYSIYTSNYVAGNYVSSNIDAVYYAGSVFGILDSVNNGSKTNLNINNDSNLYHARHLFTTGSLTLAGDTVGGVVGLVNKNIKLNYVSANIDQGNFAGYQYSAGLVGENRGIITNATATISGEDSFKNSTYVSSGLVGFNLNGYINSSSVTAEINKTNQSVVAGIVGRNLQGFVSDVAVSGNLNGYYVGGIVGADYTVSLFNEKTIAGGGGAIKMQAEDLSNLASTSYFGTQANKPFANLAIAKESVDNWINNLTNYYSCVQGSENQASMLNKKVLGLAIGLTNKTNYQFNYGYDSKNKQFVINSGFDIDGVGYITENNASTSQTYNYGFINIINSVDLPDGYDSSFAILYVVGAKVATFDFWLTKDGYTTECFAITKSATMLTTTPSCVYYIRKVSGSSQENYGDILNMKSSDVYKIITSSNQDLSFAGVNLNDLFDEEVEYEFKYDKTTKLLSFAVKQNP